MRTLRKPELFKMGEKKTVWLASRELPTAVICVQTLAG